MRLYVEGIGLLGPGLDGWQAGREVLAGAAAYVAAPTNLRASDMLPAAERRRAGVPIKLALTVGQEAFLQAERETRTASTVFTSSGGDNDNVHAINGILATAPREVSPTRFHNSVHNAAAGYWCIAAGSHEPSTSLCAHDASFAAGLLESATQATVDGAVVALIAYDHPYPEPLQAVRPITAAFAMALVLTRTKLKNRWRPSKWISYPAKRRKPRCRTPDWKCCAAAFQPRVVCRCWPLWPVARQRRLASPTSTTTISTCA